MKLRKYRLEDVCNLQIGKTPRREIKDYWGKGYSWVSISDMKSPVIYSTKEEITEKAVKECGCKLIPEGAILLSFKLSIGKLAYAGKDLFTNEAIVALGIKDNRILNKDYLYYVLKNIPLVGSNNAAMGSTLNKESLRILNLPIPEDISDQLHIANILTKAENLISQRKESIRLLDEFLKSTFLEMFGDPLRNNKGWEIKKLNHLTKVGTGGTPSRKKENLYYNGNVYWAKTTEVKGTYIFNTEEKITDIALKESNCKVYPVNTILMAMYGQGKTRGNVGLLMIESSTNQACAAIPPTDKINQIFLFELLRNSYEYLRSLARGGNQENLNLNIVGNINIIIPPESLQSKFTKIVEKTEALKSQYQKSLGVLENLYGSLSQRVFKGELCFKEESLMIAAEPEVSYIVSNSSIPEIKRGFAKQVLGGKIVSLFKDDKNFTHIKFQKIQYLAEHFAGEDLLWNYYRQSAGPYDNKFMHNVSDRLKQNKWFEERNFRFYPLEKANDIDRYYKNYFGNKNKHLNKLFFLLKNSSEKFCEAVATIYAVWNNHVILKQNFDAENIKHDFFEWSCRKTDVFTEDEFDKALQWMQKHEIVPTGFGQLIKEKVRKKA